MMRARLAAIWISLGWFACLCLPAQAFETEARAAWVYDLTTGTVLFQKNADQPLPPASMSKLMTINMLFEAVADGRVSMDETFAVSTRAREMGGSTMFLNEQDHPTVEQLIQGIIVMSGNDACVVVAEGLAGSEATFAGKMNERAQALGLTNSHFVNASGWPDPAHVMSVRDLGTLAVRLITEFPDFYHYFGQAEFEFDGRSPDNRFNRNPLLKMGVGADGLKTGHSQEAGYGLVGSAVQDNRRIVFVLAGLPSEKARAEEGQRVVDWAFREFVQKTVARKGDVVAQAAVWMGASATVGLTVAEDARLLLPSLAQDALKAEIRYTGPLRAPIAAGAPLAEMLVTIPGHDPARVPLVAAEEVTEGGFLTRVTTAFGILSSRLMAEFAS